MFKYLLFSVLFFTTNVFSANFTYVYSSTNYASNVNTHATNNGVSGWILGSGYKYYYKVTVPSTLQSNGLYSYNGSFSGTQYNCTNTYTCPSGYSADSNDICMPSSCSPANINYSTHSCPVPPLSTYDNNDYECTKYGGHPSFGISNPTGVTVFNSSFRLVVTHKCQTNNESLDSAMNLVLSAGGGLSNLSGKPDILGVWLNRGLEKAKTWISDFLAGSKPVAKDIMIGLPRIGNTGVVDVQIVEHDIPKGSDGVTPSRAPEFDVDAYNTFLREEFFPKNPGLFRILCQHLAVPKIVS